MISQMPALLQIFGERTCDQANGKYPALARVASKAPLIETFCDCSAPMGVINIRNPIDDYTVPSYNIVSDSRLWNEAAEYPDALLISQLNSQEMLIVDSHGLAHTHSLYNGDRSIVERYFDIVLKNLKLIGFVKTRPKYLIPDIRTYRLYATADLSTCFPDRYSAHVVGVPDVYDICPPHDMYDALCETDAEWVYSVNGEYKFFKRG